MYQSNIPAKQAGGAGGTADFATACKHEGCRSTCWTEESEFSCLKHLLSIQLAASLLQSSNQLIPDLHPACTQSLDKRLHSAGNRWSSNQLRLTRVKIRPGCQLSAVTLDHALALDHLKSHQNGKSLALHWTTFRSPASRWMSVRSRCVGLGPHHILRFCSTYACTLLVPWQYFQIS